MIRCKNGNECHCKFTFFGCTKSQNIFMLNHILFKKLRKYIKIQKEMLLFFVFFAGDRS